MALAGGKSDKFSTRMVMILVWIVFLATPADAFFRLLCFNPLGFGRIDPIVSPGRPSVHVHQVHGSGNLGIDSTSAEVLLASNCTSCSITVDKSAYWAPAMYFKHQDGNMVLMNTSGSITVYYKTEKRVNFLDQPYKPFPNGLRMIAGNTTRRDWVGPWPVPPQSWWGPNDTTQEALASKALGFNCLNYITPNMAEATFAYPYMRSKEFIDANCPQGIRAEVLFPSCWDGVNLDSDDHMKHVAYPTLLQDGACPGTHPIYFPILFYETIWNTQEFIGVPGEFVFSNGDPTGYGYHGDFIAAWEDGVLQRVMDDPTCTDQNIFDRHSDGLQEHCPIFNSSIQAQDEAALCKLRQPTQLVHEKVVGPLSVLPGNMKITGERHDPGPQPAPQSGPAPSIAASGSSVAPPPTNIPVASTAPPSFTNTTIPTVSTTVTPSVVKPVASVVTTISYVSSGVYYEIDVVQSLVTEYKTVTPTPNVTLTRHRRHMHGHKHRDVI